ncbi:MULTISPECIES: phage protein Gp27 family protein [unclassified Marinovum]|uniref:phage protein Gp27 family protein n=1 Tax=unclassified Marinovum TaxID=2647166 RepID=UPI003EDC9E38
MSHAQRPGRGRLSSIDLLPREVDDIVAWAADELGNRDRTQIDIYGEFVERLETREREFHGELEFEIPGLRSFNRHAMRLARMSRMLDETREIVSAMADKFDPKKSDDLTVVAAETIKALVLHMLTASKGEIELGQAKDVKMLASAFRDALQAQNVSSDRRRKAEAEFTEKVNEAVKTVARAKGISDDTVEAIKSQILGVE